MVKAVSFRLTAFLGAGLGFEPRIPHAGL